MSLIDTILAPPATPTTPNEPTPPAASQAPVLSKEDIAQIPGTYKSLIDAILEGYVPQTQHPGVAGHEASPFEKTMVRESAGRRLQALDRGGAVDSAMEKAINTAAMEGAFPDIREHVLPQPGTSMIDRATGAVKSALSTGMTALDTITSQFDRPANMVRAGIRAAIQHKNAVEAMGEAGSYGWHEGSAYVAFEDILKELGWAEDKHATNYGPAVGRAVAGAATLGLSEILPAMGVTKPIDFEAYSPEITARKIVGFVGTMLTDPLTYYTGGVGAARQLFRSGRYLNKTGELAQDTLQMMHYLAEAPETTEWLAQRGAVNLVQDVRNAARLAEAHLEAPTSATLLAAKPEVERVFRQLEDVYKESVLAGKGDEIPYALTNHVTPQPMNRGEFLSSLMDRSQESMEKLMDREGKTVEELGGIKFGGMTFIPGKPVQELAAKTLKSIGGATAKGFETVGEAVQRNLWMEPLGRRIKEIPTRAEKLVDSVAHLVNTKWRLPGHFSRFLDSRYRGLLHGVEINTIRDVEEATGMLSLAEKRRVGDAIESGDPEGFYRQMLANKPDAGPSDLARLMDATQRVRKLNDEAFRLEYHRGMVDMNQYIPDYVFHIYHNQRKLEEMAQQWHNVVNPRDPSTYQRQIPTLAEARALGLDPEEDISKIMAYRLINARRAAVTQDFLTTAVGTFGGWSRQGQIVKKRLWRMMPEGQAHTEATIENMVQDAVNTAKAAGKEKVDVSTESMIRDGIFDLGDPAKRVALGERLVDEKAGAEFIKGLPPEMQREFLRQKFISAGMEGKEAVEGAKEEFGALKSLWPGGGGVDPAASALGLPHPMPGDGQWTKRAIPGIGEAWLPDRIHRKIHEIQQPHFFGDHGQAFENVLQLYEGGLMNFARRVATAPRLAFHFRNAISNNVMSAMDIGIEVVNPRNMEDAISILRGNDRHIITQRGTGLKMTALDFRKAFVDGGGYNLFNQRAHLGYASLGEAVAAEVAADQGPARFANPLWLGSRFGNMVENDARVVHTLALWKDGLSMSQAIQRTHQFLFDYSDLTPFEKSVMRRVFMFYTWPKKAIPLLARNLVTKPRHFMGYSRFVDALSDDSAAPERRIVEKQLLPEWIRSQYGIRIGPKAEEGAFEAKHFMEGFLNQDVTLTRDITQQDKDKYGRSLRYLHTGDGQFLNEMTLQKKLGTEFMMKIDTSKAALPENGTIVRVKDGDTVVVKKKDGALETVRLLGTNTPELDGAHIIRYFTGMDLPQAELNDLWNGSLKRTLDHWTDQVGPVPEVVAGLWGMLREGVGEMTPEEKEESYARTYWMLGQTLDNPALQPLANFLEVHRHFDEAQNRYIIRANKNRVRGLVSLLMLDPILREVDRGFSPDDSAYTAIARYLTGGSFMESDPQAREASNAVKATKFIEEQAGADQRQIEYEIQRRAMEKEPLQGVK